MHVDELRQTALRAKRTYPLNGGRIDAALVLLLTRTITPAERPGAWYVQSERDSAVSYRATLEPENGCTCPDYTTERAPEGWCKHRLAVCLLTHELRSRPRARQYRNDSATRQAISTVQQIAGVA